MPRRAIKPRFTRRRKATPRRRRKPKVTVLLKNKTTAKLRYVDDISLGVDIAGITNHVFRANSCFDPDFTGVGHQPLMFDEYALLYDQYRVLSSTIKVTPVPVDNGNHIPSLYGVFRDPDTDLTYTQGTAIIEDQRNKGGWAFSGFNSYVSGKNQTTRMTTFNAKRDMSPNGANNSVPVTSNPSTQEFDYFFQVWASSWAGNDPGTQHYLVQIDYIVEFTDPKHVVQS